MTITPATHMSNAEATFVAPALPSRLSFAGKRPCGYVVALSGRYAP